MVDFSLLSRSFAHVGITNGISVSFTRVYYNARRLRCACHLCIGKLLPMSLLLLALVVGICNGEFTKRVSIMACNACDDA